MLLGCEGHCRNTRTDKSLNWRSIEARCWSHMHQKVKGNDYGSWKAGNWFRRSR